jgi:hypothetical protein
MKRRHEPASQLAVYSVEYLVDAIRHGRVRIPVYARRYVWNQDQTIAFFDSIARGYPIGTLLFSEGPAPAEEISIGPLKIHAEAEERAYWVVDGQQRLVSLAAALSESNELDRRFAIAYDLRSETFVPRPAKRDAYVIPLAVLFDGHSLRRWLNGAPADIDLIEVASDVSWNIRRYQVAAYVIQNDDPAVTMQIFERLNTSGVALRQADLFSAFASATDPSGNSRSVTSVAKLVAERTGFGIIDDNTVMRAILAARSTDVSHVSRVALRDSDSLFDVGEEALNRAVVFLQEIGEVPHVSFLASSNLLITLTRFFSLHPDPDTRNLRLLRRWLWRASLAGLDESPSSSVALRTFLQSVSDGRTSLTLQSMLQSLPYKPYVYPPVEVFRSISPASKMLICSWWKLNPIDLFTGRQITTPELSAAIGDRSIIARSVTPTIISDRIYSSRAANRILLPTIEPSSERLVDLLRQPNESFGDQTWRNMLKSHLIGDEAIWALRANMIGDFMNIRMDGINSQFANFLDTVCEWRLEDTPSLNDLIIEEDSNGFD